MIVGVIGSGAIGPDLAYGFLSALAKRPGSKVFLVDIRREALQAGTERIAGYVQKAVLRGKISAKQKTELLSRLVPTMELGDLKDCDYVLEAASEDLPIKKKILASLEAIVRPDCLIGFATSGLPRRLIASEAKSPERCFVNHPFFPAWRSLPVEIVPSDDAALSARMVSTMRLLGKVPILTSDVECFAADDVFCNFIAEAARIVEAGLATPSQVDAVVHRAIGGGGPFQVMDLTRGNLLVHKCQLLMQHAKTGSAWFAPPAILKERGDAPWFPKGQKGDTTVSPELEKTILDRILAVVVARTMFIVDEGICKPTETNWLMRMALGFNRGTLEIAADLGPERVFELATTFAKEFPGFPVPKSIMEKRAPEFYRNVLSEKRGDIGVVSVFRPEVKNALSKATLAEIDRAIGAFLVDPSIRGVVLTSDDGALAGADIGELASLPDEAACRATCLDSHGIFERIENAKKPIVAAVDGPVMGGGAELSMACHARVVGPNLLLAQPEVNLGIIPGYGGTQRLPRLIGLERAVVMLRTAEVVGTKEAAKLGWANEVSDEPLRAAMALIASGAKLPRIDPKPMALPKDFGPVDIGHRSLAIDAILASVLREGLALPLAEGLRVEADGFGKCKATVDMDIGMKNFTSQGPRVPAAFLNE